MTIGVVGWGVVGKAVGNGFESKGHDIVWHDPFKKGSTSINKLSKLSDFIFVCVPTPMTSDYKKIDLSIINDVVKKIAPKIAKTNKVLIIKSTVVPGTTYKHARKYKNTHFAMVPEFLTEVNAERDFLNPDRIIIGAEDEGIASKLARLHKQLFPEVKIFLTDTKTAEMAKYMANIYKSLKVIFANEVKEFADAVGVNYDDLREMTAADRYISEKMFKVTPFGGFGGKCFPKDIVALIGKAEELGVEMTTIKAAWKKNLKIRKVRDWENIEGAVSRQ